MTGSLAGKVVIVTGGAQGLGRAISERLGKEGCIVVVADVNERGAKDAADAIAGATGARVVGAKVDVTREAEVEELFLGAERDFGRVDVVISNAAILIAEPIAEADAERWRAVMTVNLFGYFLVTKHACRAMKKQRSGSIININSKSGKRGSAAKSAYTASSAASDIPRASRWKWRGTACVATPSVRAICSSRRFGRIPKKGCSFNTSARGRSPTRATSATFARPTSTRCR